ncbi:MAG: DNA mismatch repair endonuclease MutL [Vampirovibrionales bacterium]|nr:DNA mismatch repair endonuclease MutL [Vampirovibrionales bacterium]
MSNPPSNSLSLITVADEAKPVSDIETAQAVLSHSSRVRVTSRNPVKILPAHLVNRIAAGEVVERPASVVKELVENALDAGAARVEVSVGAAGRSIRISDDGFGMSAEDARLAFHNHATSKIRDEADLTRIQTLGFRGEALASIASISKLVCLTRTVDATSGLRIAFDSTADDPTEPVIISTGCSVGTVMEVAELFYNTPARLKFLKRPTTELSHIEEIVQALALSHPDVRFKLVSNEKTVLQTKGDGQLKQLIHDVFRLSRDPIDLVEVRFEDADAGYGVYGFTSVPGVMKPSKRWLVTFINGRTVKCHLLQKAIETAYDSLLPHGRYPLCVLHLTLPIDELDVNVHPTKREVRYANNQSVFSFVQVALKKALERFGQYHYTNHYFGNPPANLVAPNHVENIRPENLKPYAGATPQINAMPKHWQNSARFTDEDRTTTQDAMRLQAPLSPGQAADGTVQANTSSVQYKILGQLYNTYILLETAQGLMVVDQHIASERELFEQIARRMLAQAPPVQNCLQTVSITLSPSQFSLLENDGNRAIFEKLGFSYALDAERQSLALTGIPLIYQDRMPNQQPQRLFEDLLTQLEATGEARLEADQHVNHLIATLACHSAVRAGDPLTHRDMERVIQGWLGSTLPWTCPHGRPIAHTIQKEELNKFFHRPSLPLGSR